MALPQLPTLVKALPMDDARYASSRARGVPIFRATPRVQERIEDLLEKQTEGPLDDGEERELAAFEELDDLLSLVNRLVRNAMDPDGQGEPLARTGVGSRRSFARSSGRARVAGASTATRPRRGNTSSSPWSTWSPSLSAGRRTEENLALSCFACNRRKWDRRSGRRSGGRRRAQAVQSPGPTVWNEHFVWSRDGLSIVGRSSIGRATVRALDMNRERLRQIRAADAVLGRHPPHEDGRLV